jgi:hypothetical protein
MPRRTAMAVAMGLLSVVPATAMGGTGDVSRQGLLPSGGVATTSVEGAVFSPTGRYVLVTSTSNLVGGALFAHRQLFRRDRTTGRATLVSSSATGSAANAAVDDPSDGRTRPYGVSIDGRYVVFSSAATNLVATDSNGSDVDVFRKDTQTGRITIVSRDSRGTQPPDGVVGQPSLSAGITGGRGADTLFGYPVFTDPGVASMASNARTVFFGDWNAYYFRTVGDLMVERNDSVGFATDEVFFRGKWRAAGGAADLTAINLMKRSVS